jgi:hypothetical protein
VTFVNGSGAPLQLDWSSFGCARRPFGTVPPGGSVTLPTFAGHAWAFVDPASGRVVGSTVIQAGQTTVTMG